MIEYIVDGLAEMMRSFTGSVAFPRLNEREVAANGLLHNEPGGCSEQQEKQKLRSREGALVMQVDSHLRPLNTRDSRGWAVIATLPSALCLIGKPPCSMMVLAPAAA